MGQISLPGVSEQGKSDAFNRDPCAGIPVDTPPREGDPGPGPRQFLVRWLIDGTGGPPRTDVLVCVENGRIARLVDHQACPVPEGMPGPAEMTLIPALVDAHVHLNLSGDKDPELRETLRRAEYAGIMPLLRRHLADHRAHGVVAVRHAGDHQAFGLRFATENTSPLLGGVFLQTAGRAWKAQGRYGDIIGRSPEAGERLVTAIAREGRAGEWVKIVQSGINSLSVFGKQTAPQFEEVDLRDAICLCHDLGMKVMVHANGKEPVCQAVLAGADSIEHGFFMGPEALALMAERGVAWVPTACTMKAFSLNGPDRTGRAEVARRTLRHQLAQVLLARDLGVRLVLGTDAGSPGVPHGKAVREELALFLEAGLSLEEAVRAGAFEGARLLGLDQDIGTIAPGKRAAFLLLKGSPSQKGPLVAALL